jgi:hypothetical protein
MIFFLTHWKLIGVALLIAALAFWGAIGRMQLAGCRADLAESQAQVTVLSDSIQRQNDAVKALEAAGQAAQAKGAAELAKAREEARKHESERLKLAGLLAGQKPPEAPTGVKTGSCEHGLLIVREALK